MKSITRNLLESLNESISGNTIKEYAMNYLDGYIDNDVTDTEIDMSVAFSFDFNEEPDADFKAYSDFMNLIAERTKVAEVQKSSYGDTLVCDFSSVFKPYNEQLKEFFDMDNSEFGEDEAYYEAVANLEALISGNAGDSTYRELIDILNSKPMNEASNLESIIDEAARYLFDEGDKDYLPDYEEFNDYTMDISKDLFDKAKERALEALTNLAEHQYYDHDGGHGTVLELNDNHTIWELNNENKSYEEWASIVNSKQAQFKADTGVDLLLLGRMGRHACVEPTYDNCMNFTYLQETQEKLEKEAIDEFNAEEMSESADITAEVTYHDEDGTRDYTAGKLSDGRYFLIGQQEQIIVSDKDLPSLAKKDMDDFSYDEDGDKEFIKALENGTTLDKNSDLAKVIINASRKYLDDGCYLLSESANIDVNNLTKEQLWKLRQEIVLGSLYTHDYDNSFGIDPSAVCNFFDSFIEDAQMDDYGRPNNRKTEEYDNAKDLYNYYRSCENPFGEVDNMNESEDVKRDLGIEPGSDEEAQLNSLYDEKKIEWTDLSGSDQTAVEHFLSIFGRDFTGKSWNDVESDIRSACHDIGYANEELIDKGYWIDGDTDPEPNEKLVTDYIFQKYFLPKEKSKKIDESATYEADTDTEDVSGMRPIGVYTVSNNSAIYVYQIEYDIEDRVLVGDNSNETKAKWRDVIYDDNGEPYFLYGDVRIYFSEIMRTDI